MEEKYYYYRDYDNNPTITVCLLSGDGHTAWGMAVCSRSDNPCKKEGRKIARGKALRALFTGKDGDELVRDEAFAALRRTGYLMSNSHFPIFKSRFEPDLTEFEAKILRGE